MLVRLVCFSVKFVIFTCFILVRAYFVFNYILSIIAKSILGGTKNDKQRHPLCDKYSIIIFNLNMKLKEACGFCLFSGF